MPEPDASGRCDVPQCNSDAYHTWKSSPLFENDTEFAALKKLRSHLFTNLGQRRSASMDLIDALACQQTAQSVTDLCNQPQFVRQYASVRDAIHYSSQAMPAIKSGLAHWGIAGLPSIEIDKAIYSLLIVDSTPMPHAHAECLPDRMMIHDASNGVTGRPIIKLASLSKTPAQGV